MTNGPWGTARRDMLAAIAGEPDDVAGVLDQLTQLQRGLDRLPSLFDRNPVAGYNRLYLDTTLQVLVQDRRRAFADREFLNVLNVELARRYLAAVRAWGEADPATPAVWTVLFRHFDDRAARRLPYAVAGINAQINYDLAFALVATWERLGYRPGNSPQYLDYMKFNEVFYRAMVRFLRAFQYADEWYRWLSIQITRDLAWDRARQFWLIEEDPVDFERVRAHLDEVTALTGDALLSPLAGAGRNE